MKNIDMVAYLRQRVHELQVENLELQNKYCKEKCDHAKEAFWAGYAGAVGGNLDPIDELCVKAAYDQWLDEEVKGRL